MSLELHQQFMRRALHLAQLGVGLTGLNPPVGAVIVVEDKIIGEGYHVKEGLLHAERNAIQNALERGLGHLLSLSTIYVTLEPCSTTGRTPACTEAIIEHKIAKVVYGAKDPNPNHVGRADNILIQHGIHVESGILEEECKYLIRAFAHHIVNKQPWVTAKIAMTLDGRITRASQYPTWMSSSLSKQYVHALRVEHDAILTSGETLRKDDPQLTIREVSDSLSMIKEQPWRIILTKDKAALPCSARCFTDEYKEKTLVYEDIIDFSSFLTSLYTEHRIGSLMLECGGQLLRQFLDHQLVHEWVSFHCPIISGGPTLAVSGMNFLSKELSLKNLQHTILDGDVCVRALIF